jgi:hypothetical protein
VGVIKDAVVSDEPSWAKHVENVSEIISIEASGNVVTNGGRVLSDVDIVSFLQGWFGWN